jgi:MoaA/NifB/PqqE/SkfB family radical SAM enzyme
VERIRRAGAPTDAATLRLTTRCNQRCPFCQAASPHAEPDTPLPALLRAASRIASDLPNATVILTGGEPFLRADMPELLARLLDLPGLARIELQTNAVPLGRKTRPPTFPISDRLRFLIGMHALHPAIYDACTSTRGQFPRALAGVRRLLDAGSTVELNCVVSRFNLAHIPRMPALLAKRFGPKPPPLHFSIMGIPEQREVGGLLVRFREMLDAIDEAKRRAQRLGVVVVAALSASHAVIPACVLERRSEGPLDRPKGYEHEGSDPDATRWWVHGPACRLCGRRSSCLGLPRSYAERFGTDELMPLGAGTCEE